MEASWEGDQFDDADTLTASASSISFGRSSNPASGSCDGCDGYIASISRGRRFLLRLWFWRRRKIRKEEENADTGQVIQKFMPPKPDAKGQCRAAAAFATLSVSKAVGKVEQVSAYMVLAADNIIAMAEAHDRGSRSHFLYPPGRWSPQQWFRRFAEMPAAQFLQLATGELEKTVASTRAISNVLHGIFDDAVDSALLGNDSTVLLQRKALPERADTTTEAARAALEQVRASLKVIRAVPANERTLGKCAWHIKDHVRDLIKILETLETHVQLVQSNALALHSYHHTAAGSADTASKQLATTMQEACTCIRLTLDALECIEPVRQARLESLKSYSDTSFERARLELQADRNRICTASEAIKDAVMACNIVQRNVAALGSK